LADVLAEAERIVREYTVRRTLKPKRPQLRVRVTIVPKYACAHEPSCGVKEPERPLGLVEGLVKKAAAACPPACGCTGRQRFP
jgi:hypothetical protein